MYSLTFALQFKIILNNRFDNIHIKMKKLVIRIKEVSLCALLASTLFSCKKDKDVTPDEAVTTTTTTPTYSIPETYSFSLVDTLASKQRIAMLGELTGYIKTTHSNTTAPILDAQKLKDMYANLNSQFALSSLNSSGVQLKDKTGSAFGLPSDLEANFDDAAIASMNATVTPTSSSASNGVAGKLINGSRYILVDTAGFEYKEFAEKGIMGAVFYYQGTTIVNSISGFDNTTATSNGETAQERAWDEAFGYFGVPANFPTNTSGLKNWGSYCNTVSTSLGGSPTVNQTIMNAWIKGRAAISNRDDAARDEAKLVVLKTWEKVCAARFISYVKSAKANISNQATFNHNLSEAVGFIKAFKYNPAKTISDADIDILLGYFKTGNSVNLYTVTTNNLDNAVNKVAYLFNLDASLL
jgi:hypothetical protein